jgi:hypothetical protein
MDRYPDHGADPEGTTDGVELLEDHTTALSRGGATRRLGVSLPGAVAGAFLITALAFGAALGPTANRTPAENGTGETAVQQDDTTAATPATDSSESKDEPGEVVKPVKPDSGTTTKPDGDEPADGPKDDGASTDEPKDEPADEPRDEPADEPKPDVLGISLSLKLDGAKVIVDWSACEADDFVAYKVIRSTDEKVTYPRGDNDTLVGAIESQSTTAMADAAPGGKKLWYRVFGVVEWAGNPYTIACASDVKGIATPEPQPDPKPTPEPEPDGKVLGLTVGIEDGHPWVDWTSCEVDGFDAYKVVRSADSTATYPAGDNDVVIAAVGPDGKTAVWDKEAPGGKKLWYRVFCIDKTEAGHKVLAASAAKAVETPVFEPTPIPDPKAMWIEIDVTDGGAVVLRWQACGGDFFHYYKVVRSRFENPSYLPGTDGSQVIAVIENPANTEWLDGVDEGGTWYYRIQAIGVIDGQKVLLGQTEVRSVTLD